MGGHTRSGYGSGDDPPEPSGGDAAGPRVARTVFGREIHLPSLREQAAKPNDALHEVAPPSPPAALPTLTPAPAGSRQVGRSTSGRAVVTLSESELDALGTRGALRNLLVVLGAAALSFTVVALWSWHRGQAPVPASVPTAPPPAPAPAAPAPPPAAPPAATASPPVAAPAEAPRPAPVRRKPRPAQAKPAVDPDAPLPFRL
jgi:hypothetical protein